MKVKEIFKTDNISPQTAKRLIHELSPNSSFHAEYIENLFLSGNNHLYGLFSEEGELAGCCCLGIYDSLTGKKACLEDVVVLAEYQGKGGGRMLVEFAVAEAEKHHVKQLLLTSKPARIKANNLYRSMGFEKKETNVYIKKWN